MRTPRHGSRVSVVHGLPALSVILWLERRGAVSRPPYEMRVGSWLQATWQFINSEVYELSARDALENAHPGLMPLVPFMRGSDLTVIESAARIVKERSAAGVASEFASLLAVFGSRQYGNDTMRALIRRLFMSTEVLDTSPLYREWVEKAQAEGMAEGEAKGEANGVRVSVWTVLEGRFQTLDAELMAAVDTASMDALRDTLRHITSDSVDEIRERSRQRAE